jgi:hypothetical protein
MKENHKELFIAPNNTHVDKYYLCITEDNETVYGLVYTINSEFFCTYNGDSDKIIGVLDLDRISHLLTIIK